MKKPEFSPQINTMYRVHVWELLLLAKSFSCNFVLGTSTGEPRTIPQTPQRSQDIDALSSLICRLEIRLLQKLRQIYRVDSRFVLKFLTWKFLLWSLINDNLQGVKITFTRSLVWILIHKIAISSNLMYFPKFEIKIQLCLLTINTFYNNTKKLGIEISFFMQ